MPTNTIPTAEEFWLKNLYELSPVDIIKEFAKLHHQAQLEAILENATTYSVLFDDGSDEGGHYEEVDKNAIKNAYPLSNIK